MTRKNKQIWLVRHAESVTNSGASWIDHETNPLTEKGHSEAQRVSEVLPEEPSLIVTSPYVRTLETAGPTLKRWPDARHEEWPVHEFATFCYKKHGEVTNDLWVQHAQKLQDLNDPDYKDGDTAESVNEMLIRVDQAIERLHAVEDERVIMFSHGFFLGALLYRLAHESDQHFSLEALRNYRRGKNIKLLNTAILNYSFYEDRSTELHSIAVDHVQDS